MKSKNFIISLIILGTGLCSNAQVTMESMTSPKPAAYRIGISEIPENIFIYTKQDKPSIKKARVQKEDFSPISSAYEDVTIKELSKEISQELEFDEQDMVSDLSLLWQGAAMQSDTINFALYKLANPDADKPNKQTVKNILKTVASMSTLLGAGISNPLMAGSSFIGGNVLGIMTQDTKALNYKYTKVTDADMIILIRKVEDLQQNAVNLYYDYMTAKRQLQLATKLVAERQEKFRLAQENNVSREMIVITDAYYRTALDKQRSAKSNFFSKRAALEQFVGNNTFSQFEKDLAQREYNLEHGLKQSEETKQEYSQTIRDVENFTGNKNDSEQTLIAYSPYTYQDPNLSQLPELRPIADVATDIQTSAAQIQTTEQEEIKQEEAVSEEPETDIPQKLTKKEQKAAKKLAKKQAKQQKKLKKQQDKYSTKGLIFLHNNQDTHGEKTTSTPKEGNAKQNSPQTKNSSAQPQKKNNSIPSGLLPLDEIKAPDLKPNGYSIFSE